MRAMMRSWARTALFVVASAPLLVSTSARADGPDVRAHITLRGERTSFALGEPIVVDLVIESRGTVAIDQTGSSAEISIDQVAFDRTDGLYPWRADSERFTPRWTDVISMAPPTTRFTKRITLNGRVRFDEPGTYRVHVVTARVKPSLTTNDVTFTVRRLSEAEERERATALDRQLREAPDAKTASALATRLDWLDDDAATDVKLALLVGPTKNDCYFRHDTTGLWIAKDRERVVRRLEAALVDPSEEIPMGSSLVSTLISLKISLANSYAGDANVPLVPPRGNIYVPGPFAAQATEIWAGYRHDIAETLAQRTGGSRIDAAQRVLWSADRTGAALDDPDFAAAREVLIDHFEDVGAYNIDTNLNRFGPQLLIDPRMAPKLEQALDRFDLTFSSTRGLLLKQLNRVDPRSVPREIVREACTEHPATLRNIGDLPIASLRQVDGCLRAKLAAQAGDDVPRAQQMGLMFETLPYVARFGSEGLLPDVERIYPSLKKRPEPHARWIALAYLLRWKPDAYRSELDEVPPLQMSMVTEAAPPGSVALRDYLRSRIDAPTSGTNFLVSALAAMHDPSDEAYLRARLEALIGQPGGSADTFATRDAIEYALRRAGFRAAGLAE
jgi:hypothetical protein